MRMEDIVCVGGDASRAAFLLKGEKNILFDAGMAYSADRMIENIKKELKGAPLNGVLLSHSHYDHVSGLPFLRREWPQLIVYGSQTAREILERPSVRNTMRDLSNRAARGAGFIKAPEYDDDALRVDSVVREGDVLNFGSFQITVFETPGHTRCSLSYMADRDVMLCCETVGVTQGQDYMPCYLVGYQMALDAVKKLRKAGARHVFLTHIGVLTAENTAGIRGLAGKEPLTADAIWDYLESELIRTKDEIVEIIKTIPTEEGRLEEMLARYHKGISEAEQPEFAFRLNAVATLRIVQRECMEGAGI